MPATTRLLSATLISTSRPAAGLRVEAWDAGGVCPDLIDVAVADAQGAFEMRVDRANLAALLPRRKPAVVFRVFDGKGQSVPLAKDVVWQITAQSTRLQIPLADGTAARSDGPAATSARTEPAHLTVRGTVRKADGSPLGGVIVRAFDRNLGRQGFADLELAQARADGEGRYEIRYAMPPDGKVKPDLIVRAGTIGDGGADGPTPKDGTDRSKGGHVRGEGGRGKAAPASPEGAPSPTATIIESALLSPAPATAIVDLAIGMTGTPQPSEYRRLLARLAPALERGGVGLADLRPDGIAYAAGAARVRPARLRLAQQAARLERDAGAAVPAEIWYGLLRMGYKGGLASLARTPLVRQRRKLLRALKGHVISRSYRRQLDEILGALRSLVVERELPADRRAGGISTLLKHALAGHEAQAAFLSRWLARPGSGRGFWASLGKDPELGPVAGDLELTVRIATLFDGHVPALDALRAEREAGRVTSLRSLARWEDTDWEAFVARIGGAPEGIRGATPAERTQSWLGRIRRYLTRSYPTEDLRRRARRPHERLAVSWLPALLAANRDLDPRQPLPDSLAWGDVPQSERETARAQWAAFQREALTFRHVAPRNLLAATTQAAGQNPVRSGANRVLAGATDLDLETELVEAYLARKPAVLDGIDADQRPLVIDHLKATQRVLRVTQEPEAVEVLMADGLDSALRIARLPRKQFVARYARVLGGEKPASDAYGRACRTAATAQLALTHTAQCLLGTGLTATRTAAPSEGKSKLEWALELLKSKSVPEDAPADVQASWPELFGQQAWCECTDCQSVYGPAAYLVDLLHMLDEAQGKPARLLFKRRPDLLHLKLSCENTNTTIPCIDLVNEILETYIAAEEHPGLRARSRDTGDATAEELRAEPRYVRHEVYDRLADEIYPFTLPFCRPLAVVRTYLDQLGTSYRDVLECFAPADGADDLTADERIAAETLGLSALGFKLIAGTSDRSTPACYGFADSESGWATTLADVPELLRRTGVSYEELVELVKTSFVSPSQSVTLDAPLECNIEETQLRNATTSTWDRLHRFIRLWRATQWSMTDLDLALSAVCEESSGAAVLDPDALRRIGLVKRITETVERPIASLVALWADIEDWDEALLDPAGQRFAAQVPAVLAALRVSEADLGLIWDRAAALGAIGEREAETLSSHSLTVLYRYAVLAKGIGMRIADLVALLELTRKDPFAPRQPEETRAFIELATLVRDSAMPVATLDYLYRHTVGPAQGPAPADSQVLQALLKVWTALRAVRQETLVVDDPDGALLRARLSQVHPAEIVASIMEALDPAQAVDPAARARTLSDHLAPYVESDVATLTGNQAQVLAELSAWLRQSLSESAVVSVMAETLALTDALTRRLLVDWMPGDDSDGSTAGTPKALDTFLALAGGGLSTEYYAEPGHADAMPATPTPTVSLSVTSSGGPRGARWKGRLLPLADGDHVFVLRTDGVARLKIDSREFAFNTQETGGGKPIVVDRIAPDTDEPIALTAGTLPEITIEYDAGTAAGSFELLWKLADAATAAPVAAEYLFPPTAPAALDTSGATPGFTWRRLHKAALLIGGLGLTEEELDYGEGGAFGGFRLGTLPMAVPEHPDEHMERWRRLAEYAAVRAAIPTAETTLIDVFRASSPPPDQTLPVSERRDAFLAHWATQLCDATGWDPIAVQSMFDRKVLTPQGALALDGDEILARLLTSVAGPAPADRQDLQIGRRLAALVRGLDLVRRIGVAPRPERDNDPNTPTVRRAGLNGWARRAPDAAVAGDVVQAVRGRYEEDADWLEVARTRNDPLREAMRDALIAYLLPRPIIDSRVPIDADELFEHFLIDVQMAACFQTSRIKQAISSVQLFVQRCLLGQEDVSPDTIDAERWTWISRYRVWEANRKILLYPENWIEPELRLGKSPFFEELEAALTQGPLEETNIEDAFLGYLYKLDEVARLKICALHWQRETGANSESTEDDIDVLHVVARTPSVPPVFYYRQLINRSEWTPWQKIHLDIETEGETGQVHMALTTLDRRLYLFWALFTEKPEPEQPGATEGESPSPALTHWDIRLAWSTCRDGAWSPKQVSSGSIRSDRFDSEQWELENDVEDLKAVYDEAQDKVDEKKDELWDLLSKVRDDLRARAEQYYLVETEWTRPDLIAGDGDTVTAVSKYLEEMLTRHFPEWISDVSELEDWLADWSRDGWLDDIYSWPDDGSNLSGFGLSVDRGDIEVAYDRLDDLRARRNDAKRPYDDAKAALDASEAADGNVAILNQRQRGDHSIWISNSDDLAVAVLRKTAKGDVEKIGSFTLSDDARSLDAEQLDEPVPKDMDDLCPDHSDIRTNGFKIDTSDDGDQGLDFTGLPDLLARVDDATFHGEHWMAADITSTSKRPFFISQGSDCHVALATTEPPPVHGYEDALPSASEAITIGATELREAATIEGGQPGDKCPFGLDRFNLDGDSDRPDWLLNVVSFERYSFEPFHHPFTLSLIKRLNRDGIDGLLAVKSQNPDGDDHGEEGGHFDKTFKPSDTMVRTYSPYDVDFRAQGSYALYNWELFFHAPFLIAIRLMQDQRYEEARTWFHYIFDPTTDSTVEAPKRFWKVQPFRDNHDYASANELLTALSDPAASPELVDEVQAQIDQWVRHPAEPHRIAAMRLSAYQKAVVLRYLDNLIAWGDSLFAQDTIESINEATQIYVLARHLLGPRPEKVPPVADLEPLDYASLRGNLDDLSNMLVEVESLLHPFSWGKGGADRQRLATMGGMGHFPALKGAAQEEVRAQRGADEGTEDEAPPMALYFCVPGNDKLISYWDTVDDRLFKIRHCMNIEGVERLLPLFEPPIDPALLVRAAAAGLDIGSVLADLSAPLPHHRFPVMLQKALDLCGEVRSLGAHLLAALEKRDAEQVSLLRATHEKETLTAVRDVRAKQLADAEANKASLEKTREVTQARYDYYSSREMQNSWEESQIDTMGTMRDLQMVAGILHAAAANPFVMPRLEIGPTGMGVHTTVKFGGENIANAMKVVGDGLGIVAQAMKADAEVAGILGSQHRRMEEWQHQADLASKELAHIDQQIVAADIRIEIATLEQANHEKQVENATETEEVLRTKYTTQELYSWMIGRVSEVYYQAYKLAYDLAKRAERCYRFETGVATSSFVQFGYWDSLRKGLFAGEQLSLALKRLDTAYLEAARRDYEITRQVSLVLHDPQAFIDLREKGSCEVDLPEELFDADYPGHYFRRLKSVSLTLPCVAGPYTPINCTLTLLSSRVRVSSSAAGDYPEKDEPNDSRFAHDFGSVQSVATSHGQSDAGLFEVNFRDERYLPFEGAGAISSWRIDLPKETNAFDFDTLSDVILRLNYTGRDGGKPLLDKAQKSLKERRAQLEADTVEGVTPTTPLRRLVRVRYEMSDAWLSFRNALGGGSGILQLTIDKERFPYLFRGMTTTIVELRAYLVLTKAAGSLTLTATAPSKQSQLLTFAKTSDATLLASNTWTGLNESTSLLEAAGAAKWTLAASADSFPLDVKDLVLLFTYTVG